MNIQQQQLLKNDTVTIKDAEKCGLIDKTNVDLCWKQDAANINLFSPSTVIKKYIVDNDNENEQKCILADKTFEKDSSKCNIFTPIYKNKKYNLNNNLNV